jgi:Uma2 family endonuclease
MGMPALDMDAVWTVDMLDELPDDGNRYEIVDGELLVSPMPSLRHQRAARELGELLSAYVKRLGGMEIFPVPIGVRYSRTTEVQPDLAAIPFKDDGKLAQRFEDVGRLLLVVEILSPSTARHDRFTKRRKYMERGVPLYWIVDLAKQRVECWRPGDEEPELRDDRISWKPVESEAALVIDVPAFFRSLAGD